MNINDKYLLSEVIRFCEEFDKDNDKFSRLRHPLDSGVKAKLEELRRPLDDSNPELSYVLCDDLDSLWSSLIEKSIMCLRYFDKREPFRENERVPFVYGLEELEGYHKKYIDFEGELYGSDTHYRDHVFHVIRVWLLGVFLLLNRNTKITGDGERLIDSIHFEGEPSNEVGEDVKKKFQKKQSEKKIETGEVFCSGGVSYKVINKDGQDTLVGLNCFSEEINEYEKISMWTIMALCHDLGYPLEKSKKVLEKTEKMMEFFVAQPNINGNIRFDGTRDSNNKDIILFASKKMKAKKTKKGKKPQYRASIQEKYKLKYMLSLESFMHGVISSIIIYKMLIYFKEADNNSDANYIFGEEDARQFYIRRDILRAMASHTCRDIYHIDVATFPMLLFVCDELQEWGRKSWKDMYKGASNKFRSLSIDSYNCNKISYIENVNMEKARRDEVVGNIKRVLEHQYLLYQTTFRDGQDTSKRKFDFAKRMEFEINKKYRSVEKITIEFEINHDKADEFSLSIFGSGDLEENENDENETRQLKKEIEEYIDNFKDCKYGNVRYSEESRGK